MCGFSGNRHWRAMRDVRLSVMNVYFGMRGKRKVTKRATYLNPLMFVPR